MDTKSGRDALERSARGGFAVLSFAPYYVLLGASHALEHEGGRAVALAAGAAVPALVSFLLWVRHVRDPVAQLPSRAAILAMMGSAIAVTGLMGVVDPIPRVSQHLSLLALGMGLFLLTSEWLVMGLCAVWVAWLLCFLAAPPGADALELAGPLAVATLLAPLVRLVRVENIWRMANTVEAAEERAQRLRNLSECGPDPIVVIDTGGCILFSSASIQELTGWSSEELEGRELAVLMPPSLRQRHHAGISRYLRTGERSLEWRAIPLTLMHREGHEIPIEVSFGEWREHGELRFTGYLRDVSDRKRAEAERAELERLMYERQRLESIGLLASGVAHDFNNLLQPIVGNATLLASRSELDAEDRDLADEIARAGEEASLLTQQLLAYAGRGASEPRPLDASAEVRGVVQMLEPGFTEARPIELDLSPGLSVCADPAQLHQVVVNLATNAVEASVATDEPIRVRTARVQLTADEASALHPAGPRDAGEYARIDVEDHGHGMDRVTCGRVFEPFFSTKQDGRGIGLASALGIAQTSGGGLRVESEVGRGSVFSFFLPIGAAPLAEPAHGHAGEVDIGGQVLLVDDQESVRRVTRRMLEAMGFGVVEAADGMRALKELQAAPRDFRLAILDLSMAGWDGLETCSELRRVRADLPVLFTSGYAPPEEELFAFEGASSFLQKPYRRGSLEESLRALLA